MDFEAAVHAGRDQAREQEQRANLVSARAAHEARVADQEQSEGKRLAQQLALQSFQILTRERAHDFPVIKFRVTGRRNPSVFFRRNHPLLQTSAVEHDRVWLLPLAKLSRSEYDGVVSYDKSILAISSYSGQLYMLHGRVVVDTQDTEVLESGLSVIEDFPSDYRQHFYVAYSHTGVRFGPHRTALAASRDPSVVTAYDLAALGTEPVSTYGSSDAPTSTIEELLPAAVGRYLENGPAFVTNLCGEHKTVNLVDLLSPPRCRSCRQLRAGF